MLQRVSVTTHRITRKFTVLLRLCKKKSKSMVSSMTLGILKGKAIQLQAWTGPEGSRRLRPYAPAAFTPRKYSLYSFLLEV